MFRLATSLRVPSPPPPETRSLTVAALEKISQRSGNDGRGPEDARFVNGRDEPSGFLKRNKARRACSAACHQGLSRSTAAHFPVFGENASTFVPVSSKAKVPTVD